MHLLTEQWKEFNQNETITFQNEVYQNGKKWYDTGVERIG